MSWEIVIGIETHVQLRTASKIFSGASTKFGAAPNAHASPVDLALPGVLPVLNQQVVDYAIQFGLATGADIAPVSVFSRKNYFYPDLPKGYQISQHDLPIVQGGHIDFFLDKTYTVPLLRAHLEEDAGKSLHENYHGMTGLDFNRAGVPLLEIVTEPSMRSAKQAVAYAKALHALVVWLGICDGNMQEGAFRCDANVSVRPQGQTHYGTRCEIKNLNSFRFLEEAIEYEAQRQIQCLETGGIITQETRLYDAQQKRTSTMRSKEDAHDYRYFPDPDLPPVHIDSAWIAKIAADLPELPQAMRARFMENYQLSAYDANLLTQSRDLAKFFEATLHHLGVRHAQRLSHWITGEILALLKRDHCPIAKAPLSAKECAELLQRVIDGSISQKIAKSLLLTIWEDTRPHRPSIDARIQEQGLGQISDPETLEKLIDAVILSNQKLVQEFLSGKEKALNALVGQAIKASKGRANPAELTALLRNSLAKKMH